MALPSPIVLTPLGLTIGANKTATALPRGWFTIPCSGVISTGSSAATRGPCGNTIPTGAPRPLAFICWVSTSRTVQSKQTSRWPTPSRCGPVFRNWISRWLARHPPASAAVGWIRFTPKRPDWATEWITRRFTLIRVPVMDLQTVCSARSRAFTTNGAARFGSRSFPSWIGTKPLHGARKTTTTASPNSSGGWKASPSSGNTLFLSSPRMWTTPNRPTLGKTSRRHRGRIPETSMAS